MLLQIAMTIVIKTRQKKKKVPIVIDHSSSRQKKKKKRRIVLFTFEQGQKRGLVFMSSKTIEAKGI